MSEICRFDEQVSLSLRELYQRYGYTQFKMSKFEAYDLYMKNKEFLVSDGIITFTDTDGTLLALKPDVTLSIVKNYRPTDFTLQKICYSEYVYRSHDSGLGYKEIMQSGLECLGDIGNYEIWEVLLLALKSLSQISNRYLLTLSHAELLNAFLQRENIPETCYSEILSCLEEKNSDALQNICGLSDQAISRLQWLTSLSGPLSETLPVLSSLSDTDAYQQLDAISSLLKQADLDKYVTLDFSLVNNRDYYNGIVFRGYVESLPDSVLAGGQYDNLMIKMGKSSKGIGFAVYLDQISLLEKRNKNYDIDTVVLYDNTCDLLSVARTAETFSQEGVLMLKQLPSSLRYRKKVIMKNGAVVKVENND